MKRPLFAVLLFVLAGCASGPQAPKQSKHVTFGSVALLRDQWEADQRTVLARAPIDLSCTEALEVTPIDNFGGQFYYASHVVAKGCGHVAIYTRLDIHLGLSLNSMK